MAAGDSDVFFNDAIAGIICPTCKGKGYCEESDLTKRSVSPLNGLGRPKISTPKKVATPPMKISRVKEKLDAKIPLLPNKMSPTCSQSNFKTPVPAMLRPGSRGNMSETSEMVVDLIGHEDVDNPTEFAKIVKARLISKEWSDRVLGMQGAVHLCRVNPEIVVDMGRQICRTILEELNSLRSRCIRVACQAAREIFQLGGAFVFRPVFDEIVNVLMGRTADSKRVIREEADDALMAIASYCPVQHVARAFMKGPKHKHQLIRKSALRVLKTLVDRIGVTNLIRTKNYRDIRGSLLEAGCILLDDQIAVIRNTAKQVMAPIAQMPEFEVVIQEVDSKYIQKVEKMLFTLKYELEER